MKPASGSITHLLRFTGINENNFVGGGMDPIACDVGLWVMGAGKINPPGRVETGLGLHLAVSWAGNDRIVRCPNTPGGYTSFQEISRPRRFRPRTPSATAPSCST